MYNYPEFNNFGDVEININLNPQKINRIPGMPFDDTYVSQIIKFNKNIYFNDGSNTHIDPNKVWCGVFGHNMHSVSTIGLESSQGMNFELVGSKEGSQDSGITYADDFALNFENISSRMEYDGFSILNVKPSEESWDEISFKFQSLTGDAVAAFLPYFYTGSVAWGEYYDFPNTPDLNINMSIEYEGVKTIKTKGGASISNSNYTGNPMWGDLPAWNNAILDDLLGDTPEDGYKMNSTLPLRSGRRVWNLKFSYLEDINVLPINASESTNYSASDNYSTDYLNYNSQEFTRSIINSPDFFSSVFNKTLGSHIPFVFQIDKDNFNSDQFAICRFNMDSYTCNKVANNVYDISLQIEEVW